jgi:YidC/Oxa1 family membrane protein insertase
MTFLYTLIIYPLVQLIEIFFLFFYRVFKNPGVSVLGVSIAVSICILPLYFFAEKLQRKERDAQNLMKPKIDKIKAVFRGDEHYFIQSTYYKQNHYHPVHALRSVFSLLIQIPFFIAAYRYLSHLEILSGTSFFFIHDLGKPDSLFSIGNLQINILPVFMTIINIVSGAVYTKELSVKDKMQLYGMSLVFFVLLYHSPSALVLYWTMNNIFSLVKNTLQRTKHSWKIIYVSICVCAISLDIFAIFFHQGYWLKRAIVCAAVSVIFFIPLFKRLAGKLKDKIYALLALKDEQFWQNRVFITFSLILFLLAGIVIPSSLIASSVLEFSFIEIYQSPLPFILHTALQAAGIFLFWPVCIYFLFSKKIKIGLTVCTMALGIAALLNTFLVSENFGFLTNTLIFSEPKPIFAHYNSVVFNLIIILLSFIFLFVILLSKWKRILFSLSVVIVVSLTGFGIFNFILITKEYHELREEKKLETNNANFISPVYTFSTTGKNVLFIMIDRAISGYLPFIFEEKPELHSVFSGFTYYPNCASFAGHTLVGAPPLYGGYEYTPKEINKREKVTLLEKHKEAYLLLPLLFSQAGYKATVTDPPFDNYHMSNISIYNDYPQIHAENVNRAYSAYWNLKHPNVTGMLISNILETTLIRFSFFKISPLAFRLFIYDNGDWLKTEKAGSLRTRGGLTTSTIDDYVLLDILPDLTTVTQQDFSTFTMFYSSLPHYPAFLESPDYVPSQTITNRGNGPFAGEDDYHVNMASFLLLGKWISFLKENSVYDNTRIIIVADHGSGSVMNNYPKNIMLSNGNRLSAFNPLLMIKDFNVRGNLMIDNSFMTNADAPLLALEKIIENPVNPFTGLPLQSDKENGIDIVTIGVLNSRSHSKYQYSIGKNQWLHVKENIFDSSNWGGGIELLE